MYISIEASLKQNSHVAFLCATYIFRDRGPESLITHSLSALRLGRPSEELVKFPTMLSKVNKDNIIHSIWTRKGDTSTL